MSPGLCIKHLRGCVEHIEFQQGKKPPSMVNPALAVVAGGPAVMGHVQEQEGKRGTLNTLLRFQDLRTAQLKSRSPTNENSPTLPRFIQARNVADAVPLLFTNLSRLGAKRNHRARRLTNGLELATGDAKRFEIGTRSAKPAAKGNTINGRMRQQKQWKWGDRQTEDDGILRPFRDPTHGRRDGTASGGVVVGDSGPLAGPVLW